MIKEIEKDLAKYYEELVGENSRILEYLKKHEGHKPKLLHFTADIPKAEFFNFARAIAQTLYIRDIMSSTLAYEDDIEGDAAFLIEKEREEGVLYITLDDLCLRCYGRKGKRARAKMSAFVEKLSITRFEGKIVEGKISHTCNSPICNGMAKTTWEEGEECAVLYRFRVEPTVIMLCCLTDSLWKDSRNSGSADE